METSRLDVSQYDMINDLRILHTSATSIVRLHVRLADLAILHLEGISLSSHTTKDLVRLEAKVQGLSELTSRVTKESDLREVRGINWNLEPGEVCVKNVYSHRSAWRGRAARSKPSCCNTVRNMPDYYYIRRFMIVELTQTDH
jgi:hypothetical protein